MVLGSKCNKKSKEGNFKTFKKNLSRTEISRFESQIFLYDKGPIIDKGEVLHFRKTKKYSKLVFSVLKALVNFGKDKTAQLSKSKGN